MNNLVHGYYRFAEKAMHFCYLNILWLVFTLLGLGVFGIMPATAAMFSVVRKWVNHEDDVKIFTVFWKSYKKEFIRANLLGLILFAIGYVLSIELHILRSQDHIAYYIASFGVLALILFYAVILIYFFPIFVHFNLRVIDYLKWPFVIGIVHPVLTFILIVGIGLLLYIVFSTIPALLIFFGGSITAYLLMLGISQTFSKYEAHT